MTGQARLPSALQSCTIATMEFGKPAYTTPWAMWADRNNLLWLHPGYPVRPRPEGTARMRVELREDGYHVWPVPDYGYMPTDDPCYAGTIPQPFIPVAELEEA